MFELLLSVHLSMYLFSLQAAISNKIIVIVSNWQATSAGTAAEHCAAHHQQVCVDNCQTQQVHVDNCQSQQVHVDNCQTQQVCVDNCQTQQVHVDNCQSQQVRVDNCQTQQVHVDNCQSQQVRVDNCQTQQVHVDNCQSDWHPVVLTSNDLSSWSSCESSCCRRNLTADATAITMYGTLSKNDHFTPCLPVNKQCYFSTHFISPLSTSINCTLWTSLSR